MYLSELFLQHLGSEMTRERAMMALEECNGQICREMDWKNGQEISAALFMCRNKEGETVGLNKKGQEILDFWDAYKEFDGTIPEEIKEKNLLLKAVSVILAEVKKRRVHHS